jgi:plastocyanin
MTLRWLLESLLLVTVTLVTATAVPAQTPSRKAFEVTKTSWSYEPSEFRFNEGDTVVIRMRNVDPFDRPHNISTRYWLDIPLTVRGDARQGISEGRKWVALDAGKSAEVEFVARGRGSFAIICSIFDHASRGQTGTFFILPPVTSP